MAKKASFSYIQAEQSLKQLAGQQLRDTLGYELLRTFCSYGDASIQRLIDGKGNEAKDGCTLLVKKKMAYRPVESGDLTEALHALTTDKDIAKKEPRLYVVCDGTNVLAYDPKEDDIYSNTIDLLWKDFDFFKPLAGIEKVQYAEEAEADVKSAEMMARIYDDIRRYNDVHDEQQIHYLNLFMSRLLFCYFAEDTGLFPEANMFSNALKTCTKSDGSDLAPFIEQLFLAMSTNDEATRSNMSEAVRRFPYVNGGLFKEQTPIPVLSFRTRLLMIKCGEYDWKQINPDIFGSMIQAVIAPDMRAGLGIHYTSVTNIKKVIQPLFLDALVDEYTSGKDNPKRLNQLLVRLSKIKFFDPACGSGNFLIIAYKSIRELEIRIWDRLRELASGQGIMPFSNIKLTQFYGIEIDEYACDTARLSLWLAEHQMNNRFYEEFGSRPNPLPLHQSGNIVCGNACRMDWEQVCPHSADEEVYVMGNPPYLGSSMQNEAQKSDLAHVCKDFDNYKNLDYIASWFYIGSKYIQHNTQAKCAFVSTNSICEGDSVALLWFHIFALNVEIAFAYHSFRWSNNAKNKAAVTVIIVGLQTRRVNTKYIYSASGEKYACNYINAYLLDAPNIIVERHSTPISNLQPMLFGSKPTDNGYFILTQEEKDVLIENYPSAAPIIKKYEGSDSYINGETRYCLWITEPLLQLALSIEPIKERIDKIAEFRKKSKASCTVEYANKPYLFKQRTYKATDAILVPSVSSERREYIPIGYVGADTVISNLAFAVYDAELWLFGVLTSKMHNIWVRAVGGRLKTDYRYSATLCYNTFPFPKISAEQKEELTALAREVLGVRAEHIEMTLGEMYNPETMPVDLRLAHQALDAAIERCYRPEPFLSDEERLEYLFKLYERMAKKK